MHMLPEYTERFPLYALGHGESLKNVKQENVMILCSSFFFKDHFGKQEYGNSSSQFLIF